MRPSATQREADYARRIRNAKKLQLPSWWRTLAPNKGPRFWRAVDELRKEAGVPRWDVSGMTLIIERAKGFNMNSFSDITDALAKKYSGIDIDEGKAKPKAEEVSTPVYEPRRATSSPSHGMSFAGGTKIWPSEKFDLKTTASRIFAPKRPPVQLFEYTDDELDFMFSTPVKRGWEFKDWLEVIGLPTDLHEKHDGVAYQYAARAYLNRKKEAHSR